MKKPKVRKNIPLFVFRAPFLLVMVVCASLSLLLYLKYHAGFNNTTTYKTTSPTSNIYESKLMKFKIEVPSSYNSYEIEEGRDMVTLKGKRANIEITRNKTNFSNIRDYLEDSDERSQSSVYKKVYTIINNYDAVIRVLNAKGELGEGGKEYIFYIDNWAYTIFASSSEFWSDLDKIAYSFIYTPISPAVSNFKSYTSLDLMIKFEYPKTWYLNERFNDIIITTYNYLPGGKNPTPTSEQLLLFIHQYFLCFPTIEENLIDNSCGERGSEYRRTIVSKESRVAAGGTFYKYLVKLSDAEGGKIITYYFLKKRDQILLLELQSGLSKYQKEFDNLVDSIEFLN